MTPTSPYAARARRGIDHLVHALAQLRTRLCPHDTWVDVDDNVELPYLDAVGVGAIAVHHQVCAECCATRLVGVKAEAPSP